MNPQSWNRYSYVQNNPIRFNDPTGHIRVENEGGGSRACTNVNCLPTPPDSSSSGGSGGGCPGLCVPPASEPRIPNLGSDINQGGCQFEPEYLCQLPEDEFEGILNGHYGTHTATWGSLAPIYLAGGILAAYGQPVLLAYFLPEALIPAANFLIIVGESLAFDANTPPGMQVGDVTVNIAYSSDETTSVYGYSVTLDTAIHTYVLRNGPDGWQIIQRSKTIYDYGN